MADKDVATGSLRRVVTAVEVYRSPAGIRAISAGESEQESEHSARQLSPESISLNLRSLTRSLTFTQSINQHPEIASGVLRESAAAPPLDFAYVNASVYRASVLATLRDWPKTTGQVAAACGLSAPHASRALRELLERGLVTSLTPELKGRGRLYGLSESGASLAQRLLQGGRRILTTPLVRGTHASVWFRVVASKFGRDSARGAISAVGLEEAVDAPLRSWIPLRSQMQLLEEVERRFGDGSNSLVRQLAREAVSLYPAVRRYIMRALPNRVLLELAPAAYLREFNHGRLEVEVSRGSVHLRNFDWLSSRARCAAWHGSYEGLFALRNLPVVVQKHECILQGDSFCGYYATWAE